MSAVQRDPTADELLAMAYVDGELDAEAARAFERRMLDEPELAREVAELRRLEVLARTLAPPEPQDGEWARLRADPVHRVLTRLGAVLLVGGLGVEVALGLTGLLEHTRVGRLILVTGLASLAGFTMLLIAALRWRRRNLPYDPYVKVRR